MGLELEWVVYSLCYDFERAYLLRTRLDRLFAQES